VAADIQVGLLLPRERGRRRSLGRGRTRTATSVSGPYSSQRRSVRGPDLGPEVVGDPGAEDQVAGPLAPALELGDVALVKARHRLSQRRQDADGVERVPVGSAVWQTRPESSRPSRRARCTSPPRRRSFPQQGGHRAFLMSSNQRMYFASCFILSPPDPAISRGSLPARCSREQGVRVLSCCRVQDIPLAPRDPADESPIAQFSSVSTILSLFAIRRFSGRGAHRRAIDPPAIRTTDSIRSGGPSSPCQVPVLLGIRYDGGVGGTWSGGSGVNP